MSEWYWRVIALKTAFVLTVLVSHLRAEDDTVQKLPFCNPHKSVPSPVNDLVIVSTLDGKLTALSTDDGAIAWHFETQPLLSSNLHHVELTAGGKWVRLVPSLRGTLYSLSGDTIEPLPFDAEQLLSSSYKYSEDLVIAGSHETAWFGLDADTGGVIYECGSSGCVNEQQTAGDTGRDVIVLRRRSNTVRALDSRSGTEKWNFSVAQHFLSLSSNQDCNESAQSEDSVKTIGVALPEGVVGVRTDGQNRPNWHRQLEAPVAGIWRLHNGSLKSLDVVFEATRQISGAAVQTVPPALYIGLHQHQLYIQESELYSEQHDTAVAAHPIPWKLRQTHPLLAAGNTALTATPEKLPDATSLITLYGKTDQKDNFGFFLFLQEKCDQAVQVTEDAIDNNEYILNDSDSDDQSEHHHIHVHVYSLWFWWKEVLLIAISSALLMNLMIWPRFVAPKLRPPSPLPMNNQYIVVEKHIERPVVNSTEYSGRYENDFTPLRCLGRGGFGVVFEARNNIDHCSYAVKRITLPRRESKRERVLREVRALAKLEHEHIVRYFNAWLEEPPPLWQEQRDKHWMRELDGVSVAMSEDFSSPVHPPLKEQSVKVNLPKPLDYCIDALDFEKQLAEPSKRLRSQSCSDSFSIVFDDNASRTAHITTSVSQSSNNRSTHSDHSIQSLRIDQSPNKVSKHTTDDDSFIVFANSGDIVGDASNNEPEEGLSEARRDSSVDKRLERVKDMESYVKTESTATKKKKKGHTRHWSLDLCVKNPSVDTAAPNSSTKMYLYIQMQLCLRDSLHDWLRHNRNCEDRLLKVKTLFSQITSAVEYVHQAGLIHRDLKPSNIFFAPDGKVKVGDFGLVTAMSDISQDGGEQQEMDAFARHTYRVGTHLYMSPEQLLGRPYSFKVDIYSLGMILFELLQPFGTESERVASLLRLRNNHYPKEFVTKYPAETEVLKSMLSDDPGMRPTAGGVRARAPLHESVTKPHKALAPPLLGNGVAV